MNVTEQCTKCKGWKVRDQLLLMNGELVCEDCFHEDIPLLPLPEDGYPDDDQP